jgi:hypothetical protein
MLLDNYLQIKKEMSLLIRSEMTKLEESPELAELIIK